MTFTISKMKMGYAKLLVISGVCLFCFSGLAQATEEECVALQNSILTQKDVTDIRQVDWNLFQAADKGCLDIAKKMIERGAKAETRRNSGESILHVAARSGEAEIAVLLIDRGADIELRDLKAYCT